MSFVPGFLDSIATTTNDEAAMVGVMVMTGILAVFGVAAIALHSRMIPLSIDTSKLRTFNGPLLIAAAAQVMVSAVPFLLYMDSNDPDGMHSYVYCYQIARLTYCEYVSLVGFYVLALLLVANQLFFFNWQMVFVVAVIGVLLIALKPTFARDGLSHLFTVATGIFMLFVFMLFTGRTPWWVFLLLVLPGLATFVWYALQPRREGGDGKDNEYGRTAQTFYLLGSLVPVTVFSIWLIALPWLDRQPYANQFIIN